MAQFGKQKGVGWSAADAAECKRGLRPQNKGQTLSLGKIKRERTRNAFRREVENAIRLGTQIGTQKCAERAVEAVDAVSAVRNLLSKISAC